MTHPKTSTREQVAEGVRARLDDLDYLRDLGRANAYPVAYFVLIDEVARLRAAHAGPPRVLAAFLDAVTPAPAPEDTSFPPGTRVTAVGRDPRCRTTSSGGTAHAMACSCSDGRPLR